MFASRLRPVFGVTGVTGALLHRFLSVCSYRSIGRLDSVFVCRAISACVTGHECNKMLERRAGRSPEATGSESTKENTRSGKRVQKFRPVSSSNQLFFKTLPCRHQNLLLGTALLDGRSQELRKSAAMGSEPRWTTAPACLSVRFPLSPPCFVEQTEARFFLPELAAGRLQRNHTDRRDPSPRRKTWPRPYPPVPVQGRQLHRWRLVTTENRFGVRNPPMARSSPGWRTAVRSWPSEAIGAGRAGPARLARTATDRCRLLRWFELIMAHQDELGLIIDHGTGQALAEARARSPTAPRSWNGSPRKASGCTARPSPRPRRTGASS